MLAPLHSVLDREEQEKYLFFCYVEIQKIHLWWCVRPGSISHSKRQKGDYASFSELSNILKNVLSKRIVS